MIRVLDLIPCAEEIVKVLEKHKVTIFDMDKVLEVAKDIAHSSTHIQSEFSKAVEEPKKPVSVAVTLGDKVIYHQEIQR